jgi:hypothetical protein
LDAGLLSPEEIGSECDEAVGGVPIGHAADEVVDAEDFLEDDDAWTMAGRWQREVSVELAAVERFDCDHRPGMLSVDRRYAQYFC